MTPLEVYISLVEDAARELQDRMRRNWAKRVSRVTCRLWESLSEEDRNRYRKVAKAVVDVALKRYDQWWCG